MKWRIQLQRLKSLALTIILKSYAGFHYVFYISFRTFHLITNDFAQKSNEENVMCFFSNIYIIQASIEVAIFFPPLWKKLRTVSQILKRWPCKNSSHCRRTRDCKKNRQDNEETRKIVQMLKNQLYSCLLVTISDKLRSTFRVESNSFSFKA